MTDLGLRASDLGIDSARGRKGGRPTTESITRSDALYARTDRLKMSRLSCRVKKQE